MSRGLRRNKEASVVAEYLDDGLADAIRDSLKALFSERQLPDNPYYYLASALGAYVDQSSLWSASDVAIVMAMDSDGGLEVADPNTKLCRLASCSNVLGLPHVLRCVSREGAKVVHDVLTNSLSDSFFPGPTPFSSRRPGYTIQVLSSVQGSTAVWRPAWLEFPELVVRCDVVVRGPRLDEALALLAELLAADLQDLEALPVHFVEGLRFVEPPGNRNLAANSATSAGAKPAAAAAAPAVGSGGTNVAAAAQGAVWSLPNMLAAPGEFRKVLAREVLSGKQAVVAGVVMLEAPQDTAHLQVASTRFESCIKTYCFHFWETPLAAPPAAAAPPAPLPLGAARPKGPATTTTTSTSTSSSSSSSSRGPAGLRVPVVSHYGSAPYEALLEGYFLEPAACKAYLALHAARGGGAGPRSSGGSSGGGSGGGAAAGAPYARDVVEGHANRLCSLIEANMVAGATLEGFRRLLLLVLLQDGALLAPEPLTPGALLSLEELLLSRPPASQADMLLTTSVNLVRILNSGAADIHAIVRELAALMLVVQQWPRRREACLTHATAAAAAATAAAAEAAGQQQQQQQAGPLAASLGASAAAAAAAAAAEEGGHAAALLAWLGDTANMEARILGQLVGLKPRVVAATGSGVFSGISTILAQLLAQLPDDVPRCTDGCAAALAAAAQPLEALQQLLQAAALSLADALLDRCRDVTWALQRFGIRLLDSVMARAALLADGAELPPEWVLEVEAVTEAQVRAGAVAERVATEGVMLQYAVDTKLDACLAAMHEALTTPPLQRNPYPLLLHTLRAHAARLDLWQEDQQALAERLLNQLVLLSPPAFIYAATPAPGSSARRHGLTGTALASRGGGAALAGDEAEEEGSTVYGSYAAVALCDCRALQALGASLGPLLAPRSWQHGSYCADVVPALTGDACLSGALSLQGQGGEMLAGAAGGSSSSSSRRQLGGQGPGSTRSPYEHPRFYRVDCEEHHQVEGPQLSAAAALFAQSALDYMLELHHSSQHVVHQARVGPEVFSLPLLLQPGGRQAFLSALTAAVQAAVARWPTTFADACLAHIQLLAVVREGLYVSVTKRLHFAFRSLGLAHDTTSTAACAAHRRLSEVTQSVMPASGSPQRPHVPLCPAPAAAAAGQGPCHHPSSRSGCAGGDGSGSHGAAGQAEAPEPYWDGGVYTRVFLTEGAAKAWHDWNSVRGDPAQPFHYEHLLRSVQHKVHALEARGCLLDAQKLMLTAASAMQDTDMMCTVSGAMRSAAQQLRCLQHINAALRLLLDADMPHEHAAKLDGERVRRLLLAYCARLRRVLTSPKFCYFSGFAAAGPPLISQLREHVLSASRVDGARAAIMQQLNLWTLACELSVAASVHDCLAGASGGLLVQQQRMRRPEAARR